VAESTSIHASKMRGRVYSTLSDKRSVWLDVRQAGLRPISAAVTAEAWRHVYALWASNSDPEGDETYPMRDLSRFPKLGFTALWTKKPRTETITATTLITAAIRVGPRRQQRFGKAGVVS
jgi:hypothetical protein